MMRKYLKRMHIGATERWMFTIVAAATLARFFLIYFNWPITNSDEGTMGLIALQAIQDVTRRMVHLPKIIIAAVNGIAVGIGVETALASDIRLAAEEATFAFTEVKRALFETNGVMYILPRLVGQGRAMQMLLTGEKILAQEALSTGLVTRVVAQEQLMEYAMDMARTIATNAPISVRLVKQTMQRTYDLDLEAVLQLEVDGMMQCFRSEDLVEGFNAFLEKRTPVYKGK